MNMVFERKLPIPMEVKKMFPLTESMRQRVAERAEEIRAVFEGRSARFLLVIGPCSADREDSVLTYLTRLAALQERVAEKILMIPRVYACKPRTTGDGYMGFLHQPDPDGKPDLFGGIIAVRELHMRVLRETGFSCAEEMLYPENHRYLDDLLAYVAVGARSVEDQQHRLTASGLNIPVGMKNPIGGDLSVMLHSIAAAQHPHAFIYRGWEVNSTGNPLTHAVLRGYSDRFGHRIPNYHYEDLAALCQSYAARELSNRAILVDTNHANSDKDALAQVRIAKEIMHSRRADADIGGMVKGLMIESYLEDGAQPVGGGVYGQSITDPCLGWDKTERLVLELADRL